MLPTNRNTRYSNRQLHEKVHPNQQYEDLQQQILSIINLRLK
uniref:Uncharacterized protein n=1 Tax=Setaria italica TaxID=4555 RepID=K3ZGV3_SETIT